MKSSILALLLLVSPSFVAAETASGRAVTASFPVSIRVDAATHIGPLHPIWRFFGADEPNYATMKDGRKLLAELGAMNPGHVYFRAHNLLNTGDGVPAYKWGSTNAYTESAEGKPVYDWTILDRIFDTYRARGVRPYVEVGFMPKALSTHPEPYQHEWRPGAHYGAISAGWAYPPTDYAKWGELVYQWARHCVERYGRAEVEQWYWEIWNEANGAAYWHGSPADFYKLHDYAVAAIRRALPTARVGGPDAAGSGGAFMEGFLRHCVSGINYATGRRGTPVDFLSFHAKGRPSYVDGHVRNGIAAELGDIARAFTMIAAVPELAHKPIIIGEADPDGCAACLGPQLGYRLDASYASYTAEAFVRAMDLAAQHGVDLEGALTWAFEFEDQPYFSGQRVLASSGIDMPILDVFRMFARMGGDRLAASSSGEIPLATILRRGVRGPSDVGALAAIESGRLTVLVWHYHDDDVPGADASVSLALDGLPFAAGTARLTHYRIDRTHSNAVTAWHDMGSPTAPNDAQYRRLEQAGRLATLDDAPASVSIAHHEATLQFLLPREAVSLVVLDWNRP